MSEIVDLKTKLVDHIVVHLPIGLHNAKHKSLYLYLPIMRASDKNEEIIMFRSHKTLELV